MREECVKCAGVRRENFEMLNIFACTTSRAMFVNYSQTLCELAANTVDGARQCVPCNDMLRPATQCHALSLPQAVEEY